VISDCCTDLDKETHACLMKRLFPHRAAVLEAGDFLKGDSEAIH
jgi:hypothetical protein